MPLVRSWWLGKKKGKEAYVVPTVIADHTQPSGQRVRFEIGHSRVGAPTAQNDGTVSGRTGATCLACNGHAAVDYLRAEGRAGRSGQALMTVVAEGNRQRLYLAPDTVQSDAASVVRPKDSVDGDIADNPRWFSPPAYGLTRFADLFTNRQLVALTTFSDLVAEARDRVLADGGRLDYADAMATYLGLAVSRLASTNSALCRWNSATSKESVSDTFARQALPMVWDFAEGNPFCQGPCELVWSAGWVARALEWLPASGAGSVAQADASARQFDGLLVSTDPPYYDNIGYSDLSDYFYVWLRRNLRSLYPELLATMLVPKAEELVANPYRHQGKEGARDFFEGGFRQVFARARESALADFPITVYYAFKQSESDLAGTASTGWETLLEGMIRSGWEITSTWPMRSERGGRMISVGTNALASSIVLSLRPRPEGSPTTARRGFIAALEAELPDALRKLQQGMIAPVDLPQAAIGPGMAVFSRYAKVVEADGSPMTVRSALARINEILDQVLSEQEGDFDATSRFAIAWYRQHGYGVGKFGDADNLARARNTSVDRMDRDEILTSRAGSVQLIKPGNLPWDYEVLKDSHTSNWEALHHLIKVLERDGIAPAGDFLRDALSRPDGAIDADLVKELAHLLFRVAEANSWTKDALSFNSLVTSWPEILDVARAERAQPGSAQTAFDFDEGDDE
jgi:putative DNA methylase